MTELSAFTDSTPTQDAAESVVTPDRCERRKVHIASNLLRRTPEEEKWLNDQPSLPKIERGQAIHARQVIQKFALGLSKEEAVKLQNLVDALGYYQRTPEHAHERLGLIGQFGYHCAFAIGVGEKASRDAYIAANNGIDRIVEVEHALALIRKPFDIHAPVPRKRFTDSVPQPGALRADIPLV